MFEQPLGLRYRALESITFVDPNSLSETPSRFVVDKDEILTVNWGSSDWVAGKRGRFLLAGLREEITQLLHESKIVPVPATEHRLRAEDKPDVKVNVKNAKDIAARLRARPALLFTVLRELADTKVAGPWSLKSLSSDQEVAYWRVSAHGLPIVVITGRNGSTQWHLSFPGVADLGVTTRESSLDDCKAYVDQLLREHWYILV